MAQHVVDSPSGGFLRRNLMICTTSGDRCERDFSLKPCHFDHIMIIPVRVIHRRDRGSRMNDILSSQFEYAGNEAGSPFNELVSEQQSPQVCASRPLPDEKIPR